MQVSPSAIPADAWFKSSYSGASTTECVETAFVAHGSAVRDSKEPQGSLLSFSCHAWALFLGAIKDEALG